jgi:hypothetical protein
MLIRTQSLLAMAILGGMYRDDTPGAAGGGTAAAAPVPAAPNEYVNMVDQNFHFKKEKDTTGKDENGKEVVLAVGTKHPTVKMYLPVPKRERLIEFLSNPDKFPKENELLNSAVFDVIYGVARGQVNEFREKDPKATVTNAVLDYDKLDFTAIANTPKAERGAYAPSDEELKAFLEAYQAHMPEITGKKPEAIQNHVTLFQGGFKKQKGQKDILELFANMVELFAAKAPNDVVEEHMPVLEYFTNKLNRWLTSEEKITMDML